MLWIKGLRTAIRRRAEDRYARWFVCRGTYVLRVSGCLACRKLWFDSPLAGFRETYHDLSVSQNAHKLFLRTPFRDSHSFIMLIIILQPLSPDAHRCNTQRQQLSAGRTTTTEGKDAVLSTARVLGGANSISKFISFSHLTALQSLSHSDVALYRSPTSNNAQMFFGGSGGSHFTQVSIQRPISA